MIKNQFTNEQKTANDTTNSTKKFYRKKSQNYLKFIVDRIGKID